MTACLIMGGSTRAVKSGRFTYMDFGRGPGGQAGIPRLPPEHPVTTEVLGGTRDAAPGGRALELFPPDLPEVRIGLSTWGDKAYRGTLYPADARPAEFLAHYAHLFATVELSATFYGMPDAERFGLWRESVPEHFRFLPKVSQGITHRGALADAQQGLRAFLEQTAVLGERRGPVLLQMPPRFAPDAVARDRMAAALAVLRRQAAVELRHPAWFVDAVDRGQPGASGTEEVPAASGAPSAMAPPAATILREYGAALVVTDTVGARGVVHGIVTTPVLVLRFVAAGKPVVDRSRVDAWVDRIADWLARGLREVYIFVHLDDPPTAWSLARRFGDRLAAAGSGARVYVPGDAPCGAGGGAGADGDGSAGATGDGSARSGAKAAGEAAARARRRKDHGQLSLF